MRSPQASLADGHVVPRNDIGRLMIAALGLLLLIGLGLGSLVLGVRAIHPLTAIEAFLSYDPTLRDHIIAWDYRLPRLTLAVLCGAAFGVSGALIQAAMRNPLADPGLLGVNSGAAFFVTLAVGVLGWQSIDAYLWAALAGAIVVTLLVYAIGAAGRDGATPVQLVLSGVALSAVLGGIGSAVTLLDPQAFEAMRQWSVGSVSGRDMHAVSAITPFIATGLVVALVVARPLNALALGEDFARSLGADILKTRILVVVSVTLLAGAATAAAGPIGFIGLMVPHAVRWLAGPDQRWIILLTMVFSPVLLLAADIVGRLVLPSAEIEAGIVTAFLGAPVLILMARRSKASGL
ncbi:FecCD family ABC transporter permease [Shinella sp. G-2]|uniref:FecCD family ABC transporter permease n=1 Tax=Shinella sp. G-2 TaxID=3133141 RepID=UPI003CFD283B